MLLNVFEKKLRWFVMASQKEEELLEEIETFRSRMSDFLHAYDKKIFPPLDKKEAYKIKRALEKCGVTNASDRLHASFGRHIALEIRNTLIK